MERTLTNLRKTLKGDVYILLRHARIGNRFLRDAEAEGFTIGRDRPTAHPYATVMALHDGTIRYVGANGNIRFQCGDAHGFHRVDYEKFVRGAKHFRPDKP
ncbi:MAG: hypothetical protein IJT44_13035 [Clostridia bacterium]|nr:hypothetical protein [Clostridia bacterium]